MALFRGIGFRKDATRGTTPIETRKSLAGLFSATGVMPGGPSPLLTGTAGWAYTVAGPVWFVATRGPSDGVALYGNDGATVIGATGVGSTVPVAPGAGLSRIDIAWTRHQSAGENGDPATTVALASEPLWGVASGVAASSAPVAPVIPAGAIELGRNLMTSAATSTLSTGNTITQPTGFASLRGTESTVGATMGTPKTTAANGTPTSGATEVRDAVLGTYGFVAVAGRRYRVVLDGAQVSATVATDVDTIRIRNGGASVPTTASTLIASGSTTLSGTTGVGQSMFVGGTFVPGAGSVNLGAFTVRSLGTGVATPAGDRELYAVDVGPA